MGKEEPIKLELEDGKVLYRCHDCEGEVNEDGLCAESAEPCYYCQDQCLSCGRGFCDQSC